MTAAPEMPLPEPTALDESRSIELRHLAEDAVLRAKPNGAESCANCLFYLDTSESISYCWHPKLQVLVGAEWWCQWWEEIPAERR